MSNKADTVFAQSDAKRCYTITPRADNSAYVVCVDGNEGRNYATFDAFGLARWVAASARAGNQIVWSGLREPDFCDRVVCAKVTEWLDSEGKPRKSAFAQTLEKVKEGL